MNNHNLSTKLSATVSSMWTLTQMIQLVVFHFFFLSHARDETKKNSFFISLAGSKSNDLSNSICYPVGIFQISQKVYA